MSRRPTRAAAAAAAAAITATVAPASAPAPSPARPTSRSRKSTASAAAPSRKRASVAVESDPASATPAKKTRRRSVAAAASPARAPASSKKKKASTKKKSAAAATKKKKGSSATTKKKSASSTKSPAKRTPAKRTRAQAQKLESEEEEEDAVQSTPAKKPRSSRKKTQSASATPARSSKKKKTPARASPLFVQRTPKNKNKSTPRRKSTAAAARTPAKEETKEQQAAASPSPASSRSSLSPARRPNASLLSSSSSASLLSPASSVFDPAPSAGGLRVLPSTSTYPTTPRAKGVSSLLRDVPVPQTIFFSPFPHDIRAGRRASAKPLPMYQQEEEDEEEAEQKERDGGDTFHESPLRRPSTLPLRTLRPTPAQEAAERSHQQHRQPSAGFSSVKSDTPTPLSRSRSRMSRASTKLSSQSSSSIDEEELKHQVTSSSASSSSSFHSRTQTKDYSELDNQLTAEQLLLQQPTTTPRAGLVRTVSSALPATLFSLLLLLAAQLILLSAVGRAAQDLLGLQAGADYLHRLLTHFLQQYVQPHVSTPLSLPSFDLWPVRSAAESYYASYWLVPLLYVLAGLVLRKSFQVRARDAAQVSPLVLDSTRRIQARYARHVFVATHAFVTAISFWVFYAAAQRFTPEAAAAAATAAQVRAAAAGGEIAGAPLSLPVFSSDWFGPFLLLTSFAWSTTELIHFAHYFSPAHSLLFALVQVLSELALWQILPKGVVALLPSTVQQLLQLARPYLSPHLLGLAAFLPLLVCQAAECIKGVSGVCYSALGRFLLLLVPAAYLYGLHFTFQSLSQLTATPWLESVLFLATLAALSCWQVVKQTQQVILPQSKQTAQ